MGKREFQYSEVDSRSIDPHIQAAGERVRKAATELERLGIANPDGTRIRTDLPEDMRSGADREFDG